jgi:hypothetical protein
MSDTGATDMRTTLAIIIFFLTPVPSILAQQSPSIPQNSFVGVWALNPHKVTFPKGKEIPTDWPKYFVDTITVEGAYLAISTRRGPYEKPSDPHYVMSPEDEVEAQWFYRCDGKVYNIPGGSVSCRTVNNVPEGSNVHDNNDVIFGRHQEHFWRSEVSADGSEMKISYYNDKAMTKLRSTVTYDRKQ